MGALCNSTSRGSRVTPCHFHATRRLHPSLRHYPPFHGRTVLGSLICIMIYPLCLCPSTHYCMVTLVSAPLILTALISQCWPLAHAPRRVSSLPSLPSYRGVGPKLGHQGHGIVSPSTALALISQSLPQACDTVQCVGLGCHALSPVHSHLAVPVGPWPASYHPEGFYASAKSPARAGGSGAGRSGS